MSSEKYTMNDVRHSEKLWIEMVAQNEMRLIKQFKEDGGLHLAYEMAENNAWIIKTLADKKQRYRFKTCKNLVMIGSGMYPYSMFDVYKKYPEIKQVGLEIEKNRAFVSKKLIEASPAKDAIKILNIDAIHFDYSWLGMDDLIFVSVDVDHKDIIDKIIKTSKAHVYICAPYEKTWLVNLIRSFSL